MVEDIQQVDEGRLSKRWGQIQESGCLRRVLLLFGAGSMLLLSDASGGDGALHSSNALQSPRPRLG